MLTGLFFLGGLVAFSYLCWWIYDNERHPDGLLPKRGLLAMAAPDKLAADVEDKKAVAWKKGGAVAEPADRKARSTRTPSYRRTGR